MDWNCRCDGVNGYYSGNNTCHPPTYLASVLNPFFPLHSKYVARSCGALASTLDWTYSANGDGSTTLSDTTQGPLAPIGSRSLRANTSAAYLWTLRLGLSPGLNFSIFSPRSYDRFWILLRGRNLSPSGWQEFKIRFVDSMGNTAEYIPPLSTLSTVLSFSFTLPSSEFFPFTLLPMRRSDFFA